MSRNFYYYVCIDYQYVDAQEWLMITSMSSI